MTPAEFSALVERLDGLLERATPGPWVFAKQEPRLPIATVACVGDYCVGQSTPGYPGGNYRDTSWGIDESDAALIASSPEAIRALLTALRETRAALDTLMPFVDCAFLQTKGSGPRFEAVRTARAALSAYPIAATDKGE